MLEAHFSGKIDLNVYARNFTRIDLKALAPNFQYRNWETEKKALKEYIDLQNEHFEETGSSFRVDMRADSNLFYVANIGKRYSNRVIRLYISGLYGKKTFEKEIKISKLKGINQILKSRNYYEFNKFCVLELLEITSCFVICDMTKPLIDWKNNFLFPLKLLLFPNANRQMRNKVVPPKNEFNYLPISLNEIKKKTFSYLGLNLYDQLKQAFSFPIHFKVLKFLMFSSTEIVKNWRNSLDDIQFRDRIQKFQFTQQFLDNELNSEYNFNYKLTVDFKTLIEGLGYVYSDYSRKQVRNLLFNLLKLPVSYPLEFNELYQETLYTTLLKDLYIRCYRGRDKKASVSFYLHPILFYNFLKNNILISDKTVKSYYDYINTQYRTSKTLPLYIDGLFLGLFIAINLKDNQIFRSILKMRAERIKKDQEKFLDVLMFYLELLRTDYGIIIGCVLNNQVETQVSLETWKKLLLTKSNRLIDNVVFTFNRELIHENENE